MTKSLFGKVTTRDIINFSARFMVTFLCVMTAYFATQESRGITTLVITDLPVLRLVLLLSIATALLFHVVTDNRQAKNILKAILSNVVARYIISLILGVICTAGILEIIVDVLGLTKGTPEFRFVLKGGLTISILAINFFRSYFSRNYPA